MTGRGRPLRPWVQYVRQFLVEESERLSQLGTKITSQVLIDFAHNALRIEGSQYDENSICTTTNRPISDQIDSNFIERLCESNNLVRRFYSGNNVTPKNYLFLFSFFSILFFLVTFFSLGFWSLVFFFPF